MQMFVTQGIKAVRMDDIAQQLGVSKRTLYELFDDKENLLYLACNCYFDREHDRRIGLAGSGSNIVEGMFIILSDVLNRSEIEMRLINNLRKFYPEVSARIAREGQRRSRMEFREMLDMGRREGLFTDRINLDLAISIFWTLGGLGARGELALPEGMTRQEACMQIVITFMRSIATVDGLRLIDEYAERYNLTVGNTNKE